MSALLFEACNAINAVVLYKILSIPLLVWLFIGTGLLLMIRIGFANITYLPESIRFAFGKTNGQELIKEGVGPITAFMSQLAANLGVNNFAGSVLALYYGGPGVILWFFILSLLSGAIKFGEVVLSHKYRIIENGEIKGGPFYFIEKGMAARFGLTGLLVKTFAVLSALGMLFICLATASVQSNQLNMIMFGSPVASDHALYGMYLLNIAMLIVIMILLFGGLKAIGPVADILVPPMGLAYIAVCLFAIISHYNNVSSAIILVLRGAIGYDSGISAAAATCLFALQKLINATDTGAGLSGVSQSCSSVKLSGQQGLISFFDPFIVASIMSIGAFAVLVVGVPYQDESFMGLLSIKQVFVSIHPIFNYVLMVIVFLFAFTTIMSLGFYVKEACIYLFGTRMNVVYIIIYVAVYSIGGLFSDVQLFIVLDMVYSTTVMINIIGISLLSRDVQAVWDEYKSSRVSTS